MTSSQSLSVKVGLRPLDIRRADINKTDDRWEDFPSEAADRCSALADRSAPKLNSNNYTSALIETSQQPVSVISRPIGYDKSTKLSFYFQTPDYPREMAGTGTCKKNQLIITEGDVAVLVLDGDNVALADRSREGGDCEHRVEIGTTERELSSDGEDIRKNEEMRSSIRGADNKERDGHLRNINISDVLSRSLPTIVEHGCVPIRGTLPRDSSHKLAISALRTGMRTRLRRGGRRKKERQENKAAKTLSAILLAFIITWTPYNVFTVISLFCDDCINPMLYAFG